MPIGFVAATGSATGASAETSRAVNVPAGTLDGHTMIAMMSLRGGVSTDIPIIAPGGGAWSLVMELFDVGSPNIRQNWYSRIASSEPSSYTWTSGTAEYWTGHIATYSGVDTVTPVHVFDQVVMGTGSTSRVTPTVAITASDCWLLSGFTDRSGSSWTGPDTERDERLSGNNSASSVLCDSNGTVSTGSTSRTATASVSSSVGVQGILALLPATTPAPARGLLVASQAIHRAASW